MKLNRVIVFLLVFGFTSKLKSQSKSDVVAVGAGVAAAALLTKVQIEAMKDFVEHKSLEWYLTEYGIENGKRINVECLNLVGEKWNDISSTNSVLVRFTEFKTGFATSLGGYPTIRHVIFVTSDGWWNQYGTRFNVISPIVIDDSNIESLLLGIINLMGNERVSAYSSDSIVYYQIGSRINQIDKTMEMTKKVESILSVDLITDDYFNIRGITFKTADKKEYNIGISSSRNGYTFWDIDDLGVKLSLSSKGVGFFLKETQDLVVMKNKVLNEIFESYSPLRLKMTSQ